MAELITYLETAVGAGASDIFAVAGAPVTMKTDGQLTRMDETTLYPGDTMELIRQIYEKAGRSLDKLTSTGDDDFSVAYPGLARFRVNTYRQRSSFAMVIRVVAFDIPDWQKLRIPKEVIDLSAVTHGMVLVTGTAGSGKSTTLTCIIDAINRSRSCHIVTLEDPIEFLHRDRMSIVSQREIAVDTNDFLSALRACMRQAPDVILVGEMRDHETIKAAMTAAETGHMLLATLHTRGAVNTIDRIIDSFPPEAQYQVRVQLSTVLDTVVSQQLVPDKSGNLVPACEIMHMTPAIRSMIRDSKTHQINNAIATGAAQGMISMDQSLLQLCKQGVISEEIALEFCDEPEQLRRRLRG